MATTNAKLALEALDAMRQAGVRFALLHGRDRLLNGEVSDVDLVISERVSVVISKTRELWKTKGLIPVVVWPYDIGGTATVFLATEDASEGVQLDFLFDPDGKGKYGVRSGPLLATADSNSFPPVISDESKLVYLWRKRIVKDQPELQASLMEQARQLRRQDLVAVSGAITGSPATAAQILDGARTPRSTLLAHPVSRAAWLTRRIFKPVGFWAHVSGHDIAEDLARRFGRFLVTVATGSVPEGRGGVGWWATKIQPLRLRSGLFLSQGNPPRWPPPDLIVSGRDPEQAARAITSAMSVRIH